MDHHRRRGRPPVDPREGTVPVNYRMLVSRFNRVDAIARARSRMAGRTISTPQVLREQYEDYLRLKREELYRQMMSEVKTIAGIYERETDRLNLDRIRGALFTKIGELVAKHAA